MEHSVPLQKLPPAFEFPEKFKDRMRYDAERQQLVFSGFMCKSNYDELVRLSPSAEYQIAVERLFELSAQSLDNQWPKSTLMLQLLAVLIFLSTTLIVVSYFLLWRSKAG